jgi:hypothetical protein
MGKGGITMNESKREKPVASQKQSGRKPGGDDSVSLLHELIVYTKLANYENIRNRLITILDSEDKKRVFEATDGNNGTRQIESITGVNKNSVSNWWDEWEREGIVEESKEVRGRQYKIVSLGEFGIKVAAGKKERSKRLKADQISQK